MDILPSKLKMDFYTITILSLDCCICKKVKVRHEEALVIFMKEFTVDSTGLFWV